MGNRVYQLTWKERTGFVYDKDTLQPLDTFTISSDGWGLTHDGNRLIRSDGTSTCISSILRPFRRPAASTCVTIEANL